MKKNVEVTYVVASKLGSIGMGSTAYNALKGIESANLDYAAFSRGYNSNLKLNKSNLVNYTWLEYLSYPFRFLEKKFKIQINSFALVNYLFGKLVYFNLPKTKIYHTWIGISQEAIEKSKKQGAILVLEGANSHPLNVMKILEREYKKYGLIYPEKEKKEAKKLTKILKQFDYVMCPSQFVYNSFLEEGFRKDQLIYLPYGVTLKDFPNKQRKTNGKMRFVFVGSIQLRKGVQYLLKAWSEMKLRDAELVLVGRIWPDAQKVVEKYKTNKTIVFPGFDSNPKKYLLESDVFISPSLEEGSALTCYEAMACGLPLIATFNTGSIIRNNKEGFVIDESNVEQIKEKIKYFCNNPQKVKEMGKNARKLVEKYDWKNYGRSLVKFYRRTLNEK